MFKTHVYVLETHEGSKTHEGVETTHSKHCSRHTTKKREKEKDKGKKVTSSDLFCLIVRLFVFVFPLSCLLGQDGGAAPG